MKSDGLAISEIHLENLLKESLDKKASAEVQQD